MNVFCSPCAWNNFSVPIVNVENIRQCFFCIFRWWWQYTPNTCSIPFPIFLILHHIKTIWNATCQHNERKHLHTRRHVTVICKRTRSGSRSTGIGWLMYLTVSVIFSEPFCDSLPLSIPLKIFRLSALLHLLFLNLSLGCMTLVLNGSYVSQMMQHHMTSFAVTLWMQ
jgi:hypothetical protein